MVIDTPGMREFGMWDNDTGIERTFMDIEELAAQCKFRNCTHTNEPDAIQKALTTGKLEINRCESYQKLKAENDYMEDKESYMLAKGMREKQISKLIKKNANQSVKKGDTALWKKILLLEMKRKKIGTCREDYKTSLL